PCRKHLHRYEMQNVGIQGFAGHAAPAANVAAVAARAPSWPENLLNVSGLDQSPISTKMPLSLPVAEKRGLARGEVDLIIDAEHFRTVVREGIMKAKVSIDIATADFKAMLVPTTGRRAQSIVQVFRKLADRGVEIRLLHAGTPSEPALRELKQSLP